MKRLIAILAVLALCLSVLPMAAFAADATYYVAGSFNDWKADGTAMTKEGNLWKCTVNLAKGKHEFKVTNGTWNVSYPSANYAVEVTAACDVTITFDPNSKAITVSGAGLAGPAYYVAGSFNNWKANGTTMTKEGNVWKCTINMTQGNHEFKVTNGTWDVAYPGENVKISVETDCAVTIAFDETTKKITVTGSGLAGSVKAPAIEYMEVVGAGVEGLTWNPGSSVKMTKTSEGVYVAEFNGVAKDTQLSVKFAANGNWNDYNIGGTYNDDGTVSAVMSGSSTDIKITAPYATTNVKLTLDLTQLAYAAGTGISVKVELTNADTNAGVEEDDKEEDKEEEKKPEAEITEITVHAQVPADWGTPKVWAWSDAGDLAATPWPGELDMTQGENGWWSIKIPVGMNGLLIVSNDASKQTVDIIPEQQKMDIWAAVGTAGGDGKFAVDVDYTIPKTGDETALVSAAIVMALAIGATALVLTNKKKFGI